MVNSPTPVDNDSVSIVQMIAEDAENQSGAGSGLVRESNGTVIYSTEFGGESDASNDEALKGVKKTLEEGPQIDVSEFRSWLEENYSDNEITRSFIEFYDDVNRKMREGISGTQHTIDDFLSFIQKDPLLSVFVSVFITLLTIFLAYKGSAKSTIKKLEEDIEDVGRGGNVRIGLRNLPINISRQLNGLLSGKGVTTPVKVKLQGLQGLGSFTINLPVKVTAQTGMLFANLASAAALALYPSSSESLNVDCPAFVCVVDGITHIIPLEDRDDIILTDTERVIRTICEARGMEANTSLSLPETVDPVFARVKAMEDILQIAEGMLPNGFHDVAQKIPMDFIPVLARFRQDNTFTQQLQVWIDLLGQDPDTWPTLARVEEDLRKMELDTDIPEPEKEAARQHVRFLRSRDPKHKLPVFPRVKLEGDEKIKNVVNIGVPYSQLNEEGKERNRKEVRRIEGIVDTFRGNNVDLAHLVDFAQSIHDGWGAGQEGHKPLRESQPASKVNSLASALQAAKILAEKSDLATQPHAVVYQTAFNSIVGEQAQGGEVSLDPTDRLYLSGVQSNGLRAIGVPDQRSLNQLFDGAQKGKYLVFSGHTLIAGKIGTLNARRKPTFDPSATYSLLDEQGVMHALSHAVTTHDVALVRDVIGGDSRAFDEMFLPGAKKTVEKKTSALLTARNVATQVVSVFHGE